VLDREVEEIAKAVFEAESFVGTWETTTESLRGLYRHSIRLALNKARAALGPDGTVSE
jgi:hypothetical protein